jgi:hypothetical protein
MIDFGHYNLYYNYCIDNNYNLAHNINNDNDNKKQKLSITYDGLYTSCHMM